MRNRALLSLVVLFSTVAFADDWSRTYKVGSAPSLTVSTSDASIEVRAGNEGTISANFATHGYTVDGSDPDFRITESQSGDSVTISAKEKHGTHFCIACVRWARFTITVPAGTHLNLQTGDGSVKVMDVKGPTDLRTSDGSIEISNFDGRLQARTSDGSIRFEGRFDELNLDTSDGSINGTVQRGSNLSTDWRIRTADGSVRIALPSELSADVNMSTADGSVHSDLPINDVHEPHSHNSINGKLNGGGRLLTIRTSDGSIHITRT